MILVTYTDGSIEYLTVTVSADVVELTDQPVALSIDRGATWLPCVWIGEPGMKRQARTAEPITFAADSRAVEVRVRVTDNPEVPIIPAGSLMVQS